MLAQITAAELSELGLSPREAEVFVCLARGKSNAEIGALLGISPRTAKKHLEHIFRKLGVKTRVNAMIKALEILQDSRNPTLPAQVTS